MDVFLMIKKGSPDNGAKIRTVDVTNTGEFPKFTIANNSIIAYSWKKFKEYLQEGCNKCTIQLNSPLLSELGEEAMEIINDTPEFCWRGKINLSDYCKSNN